MEENKNDILDTICRMAWDYPVMNFSRNEFRSCCRAKSFTLTDENLGQGVEIFTKYIPLLEVRRALLKGEKHVSCSQCWAKEATTKKIYVEELTGSTWKKINVENKNFFKDGRGGLLDFVNYVYDLRNHTKTNTNNKWAHMSKEEITGMILDLNDEQIEDLLKIDHTNNIEISLGNTCDLKCVYCSHHYSTQWAAELIKFGVLNEDNIEKELPKIQENKFEKIFWQWFEEKAAADAATICFIGGEPLIMDKFYDSLERIIHFYDTHPHWRTVNDNSGGAKLTEDGEPLIRPMELSVVTNFNTPKKYYNRFKNSLVDIIQSDALVLDFNVSCESLGKRAEYIRTGTNWNTLNSNIHEFLKFVDLYDTGKKHKVYFNLQIALNTLCISDLPNFFRWVVELKNSYKHVIHLRPNLVSYPHWCWPAILPKEYHQYFEETIEIIHDNMDDIDRTLLRRNQILELNDPNFAHWSAYAAWLDGSRLMLKQEKNKNSPLYLTGRKEFAYNINLMQYRRKLDFHGTFPEMVEFYDECMDLAMKDDKYSKLLNNLTELQKRNLNNE